MTSASRPWLPEAAQAFWEKETRTLAGRSSEELERRLLRLVEGNRELHDQQCVNLDPATNTMNPRAEALLASGLGSRPSLGYPGDKYETGLEAIEKIEVLAHQLVSEVFRSPFAELRVASGAMANLYAFMATTQPGDSVLVPPPEIGGHVTHQSAGAAGLYGLTIHPAPIDAERYTVDLDALREQVHAQRPRLITIGGSLNLTHHPVAALREIADEVGAWLLFDAAHLCGMIAGGAWPNPLEEGAHLMTFSTYKSLGGPPSGVVLTQEAELAERLEAIAFPGLTANHDAGKVAALAMTLLDWREHGAAYATQMKETAWALAEALAQQGLPVHRAGGTWTVSHQLALQAARWGGGQALARHLRQANLLTCGIGLPIAPVSGDLNGLRLGTPEMVRWGLTPAEAPELAAFFERLLVHEEAPAAVAPEVSRFRQRFTELQFIRPAQSSAEVGN